MTSKEFDKISNDARRGISNQRGWHQSGPTNWIIKRGYFFCLQNDVRDRAELEVKPMYVDELWWKIIKAEIKLTNTLRTNPLFTASLEIIGEINVFPSSKSKDYPLTFFEETWNRVFSKTEATIDVFISEHPDPEKYVIDNQRNELLYLVPRIHNEMHKEVLDYIAAILAYRNLDRLKILMEKENVVFKLTYDYILEWYELYFPEVLPQALKDKIIRN